MELRSATEEEVLDWDHLIKQNPDGGNLLQSSFFATQKRANGWVPRYMIYEAERSISALFLVKKVPSLGQLWYAPKGPGIATTEELHQVAAANSAFARQHRELFLFKTEPEVPAETNPPASLVPVAPVQPNVHTIIVDLTPSEDEIFAGFRQRARRSIRKAHKQGVTVETRPATDETMRQMYRLYKETADRAGFYLRDYDYYEQFWGAAASAGYGSFHFAMMDGEAVAGVFVTYYGVEGLYKDGASSRMIGNTGAPYLLQWEVMKQLKAQGATRYDLHTTPPPTALDDTSHPKHGLGQFKSAFSKEITSYVGTLDQPVRRLPYAIWRRIGQRVALSLTYRLKHRLYY